MKIISVPVEINRLSAPVNFFASLNSMREQEKIIADKGAQPSKKYIAIEGDRDINKRTSIVISAMLITRRPSRQPRTASGKGQRIIPRKPRPGKKNPARIRASVMITQGIIFFMT